MKLIKINTNHYVVVDGSEIKEGDWVYDTITNNIWAWEKYTEDEIDSKYNGKVFKITHSTQPLETSNEVWEDSFKRYDYITLQEIKELLGKVDVEKKIYALCQTECIVDDYGKATDDGMVIGIRAYNQALEDNKDKKYTEEDMIKCWKYASMDKHQIFGDQIGEYYLSFIQSLQPKTEWKVEIVDGKLKLI